MTDHEKLLLRRHLERAKRSYLGQREELLHTPGDSKQVASCAALAFEYEQCAQDCQRVIDRLSLGQLNYVR